MSGTGDLTCSHSHWDILIDSLLLLKNPTIQKNIHKITNFRLCNLIVFISSRGGNDFLALDEGSFETLKDQGKMEEHFLNIDIYLCLRRTTQEFLLFACILEV